MSFLKRKRERRLVVALRKKRTGFRLSRRSAPKAKDNDAVEASDKVWRNMYTFLTLSFAVVCVYMVFFSTASEIQDIRVEGIDYLREGDIRAVVAEQMGGKIAYMFPRNHAAMLFPRRIESALRERFPGMRSVQITTVFPATLVVSVKERQTTMVWCGGDMCWLVDEDGSAYARSGENEESEWSDGAQLLRVTDVSGAGVSPQEPVAGMKWLRFVQDVRRALREQAGIETLAEASTPSRLSDEIHVKTTEGWEIYFDTTTSTEESVHALSLLLKKEIGAEDRKRLRYVDMRVPNRAYYAFLDEQVPENPEGAQSAAEQAASMPVQNAQKSADAKDKKENKK